MRLGDLDALFVELWRRGNPFDDRPEVHPAVVWSAAATLVRESPSINSEALPIVQQLREELKARIEGRWIPCSERLPKEKQRVIVRCATVGTTVGWILWGEWMTDLGRECADVTHWMPLPQPPKEG